MKMLSDTNFARLLFLYGRRLDIQLQMDLCLHTSGKWQQLEGELELCQEEIERIEKLME